MKQRILLKNETLYNGRDLRRLFLRCLKERGVYGKWRRYTLCVVYSRGGGAGGYGKYNQPWVKLTMPKLAGPSGSILDRLDAQDEAARCGKPGGKATLRTVQIIMHEIDHNLGLQHKDMAGSRSIEAPWVEAGGYRIRWGGTTVKYVKVSRLQERRGEHARKKLAEWGAKQKRADRKVKEWAKKVKYYDKAHQKKLSAAKKLSFEQACQDTLELRDFSARAFHALSAAGIHTWGEAASLTKAEMLVVMGESKVSLGEVERGLASRGFLQEGGAE